jgi:cell division initiation protein
MPIRPIDVRRKEFKSGFRGYDANQVDDFLDAVADEYERNYTENQRMREEVSSLRDRLQQFEDLEGSIRAALVHAEQASNDLRRAATEEAEGIKLSAQREAEFTIREAQSRSHHMLADSSSRIERVQDSYIALQEAKRSFANDFRLLLRTFTDVIENLEVSSAREIDAYLHERLDTESIADVHEAAAVEARSAEEAMVTAEAMDAAGMVPEPGLQDAEDTLSGIEVVEPAEKDQETLSAVDEQPTEVIRPGGSEPVSEPETEDPEVVEPEVEPSTAQGEPDQTEAVQEPRVTEPEAASEVEREEPSLAEESSSEQFFDTEEGEQTDSRVFRASRFLRRRE